jgi:hypothetical protein
MFWKAQYDALLGVGLFVTTLAAIFGKSLDTFIMAFVVYVLVRLGVWFLNLFMTALGVPLFYHNKVLFDDE